jgi:DtxR family Mn-dependent transcriptional regulator
VATSTVEDYLKTILLAEGREGPLVGMGRIADELGVAPGTVTAMVKTLARSRLVDYAPYSGVQLTEAGRRLALRVLRRHRLIELLLVRVLGMSWSEVHQEAEELEHAVSDRLIELIDELLGFPSVDPHGDPIPNAQGVVTAPELTSLPGCGVGERLEVGRVGDQGVDFLRLLDRLGLVPGSSVTLISRDDVADTVLLENAAGERVQLGIRAAAKIFVGPSGSPASDVGGV